MTLALSQRAVRLGRELAVPMTAALLVTGIVRLLLSVKASCDVLQCDDFGRFWYATSGWWARGTSLYALTPASVSDDGLAYLNLNLPHTHLVFLPFIALPMRAAAAAWLVTGLFALGASLLVIHRETGWRITWPWLLVVVWWMPTHVQAVTGQLAWLLLVPLTLSWSAARHGRWLKAGAWLGIVVAVKPFLLPMLVWMLWRGHFRSVLLSLAVVAAIVCGGLALFGADQYQQWRDAIGEVQWYGRPLNASLWGAIYRTFVPNNRAAIVADLGAIARNLALAASGVVALATWLACRHEQTIDDQWTLVLSASLLICPLGWVYYGTLLLPGWRGRWPGALATACWLIPTPWLEAGQPSPIATVLWGSAATWGLLLIWLRALRPS